MYSASYEPLIGEIIESVETTDDSIKFTLFGGETLTYETYGDCCSSTWIEHLTVPNDIRGALVTGVTEPDLPPHAEVEEGKWYDVIAVYHTAFQTDKGEIILEYRNSSNGYYGGNLVGPYIGRI